MDAATNVIPLRAAAGAPPLDQRDDDDLMRLARTGMMAAFDVLVRRHQKTVLRVASRQLHGDMALAMDASQQTFLELYRYLPRYEPRGRFRALLFRILCNHCRGFGRKRRPTTQLEAENHRADGPDADQALLRAEQSREMERLVATLSEKLRVVVVLRFSGDLSHEEIAAVLDLPVGTVRSRLFAALGQLHQSLTGAER